MTDNRITTATTWSGWQIVSPRCYGCLYSVVTAEKAVCYCQSRIIRNGFRGDICESYFMAKVVEE